MAPKISVLLFACLVALTAVSFGQSEAPPVTENGIAPAWEAKEAGGGGSAVAMGVDEDPFASMVEAQVLEAQLKAISDASIIRPCWICPRWLTCC